VVSGFMVVAVVGLARSGTSCVAGILHHLGVCMGHRLRPADECNPRGYFEDHDNLRWSLNQRLSSPTCVKLFRRYGIRRYRQYGETIMGIKVGRLCVQVHELAEAFPRLKLIVTERCMEEVVVSQIRSKMWPHLTRKHLHARAIKYRRERDAAIESFHVDALRVRYDETLFDPASTIRRIVEFIEITPSPDAIETARKFVAQELRHFVGNAS